MQDRECSGHGSCALGKCFCQVSIIILTAMLNIIIIFNIIAMIIIIVIIITITIITLVGWTGDSCEERNEQIFR